MLKRDSKSNEINDRLEPKEFSSSK